MIAADKEIDRLREDLDAQSIDLLARQQPVATDLRMVVTAMRMSADLERMGDLARHVAKVARLRYPESAVPAELRATILQMGQVAERIVAKAGSGHRRQGRRGRQDARARRRRDGRPAPRAVRHALDGTWTHGTEAAVDMTLVGRYYERFADHAVSVAHRVVYLVTGECADQRATTATARAATDGARTVGGARAPPARRRHRGGGARGGQRPWLATAAAASAAASGSRYSPGPVGMKSSPRV